MSPIKTSSAKAKARELQKHIRDKLLEAFKLREGDVESRSMGASGVDILMSPLARDACPISFECKNTVSTPTKKDLKQSKANAYKGTIPVIVWKPKGVQYEHSQVIMEFNDLINLIKLVKGIENE